MRTRVHLCGRARSRETTVDACLCRHHRRYELSLYAHISNITWQLERGTSCVRGTVSDLVSKDIKSISLDPATMSEFELVNAVWAALS